MPTLLLVAWVLLASIAGIVVVVWILASVAIQLSSQALPRVGKALELPAPDGGWPRLSLVVPIHNEEDIIDTCVSAVRAQDYPNLEILLCLDRCTDGTAAIVARHAGADPRIKVHAIAAPRPGWGGKCMPMQVGFEHADGRWVLFVDADTTMDARLVRAAIATALHHGFEMLGVLPELRAAKPFELIAQPVAVMQLMHLYPPAKVNRPGSTRPFGLGPFMLVRADLLKKIGGMESFKDTIQEDVQMARAIHRAGGRVGLALSAGLFSCAMYESMSDFAAGWNRIFMGVFDRNVQRLRRYAWRMLAYGAGMPVAQLLALGLAVYLAASGFPRMGAALAAIVLASVLAQALALLRMYRMGGSPAWAVLAFPLGCLIVGRILLGSARDLVHNKTVRWGGRDYVLQPRYGKRR